MSCCFGCVSTGNALYCAASVLLVLTVNFVVLLCFCWYCQRIVSCCLGLYWTWQCIVSCCLGFVGTGHALCCAACVLFVLADHCVVLLRFCWYWYCILSCCLGFVVTGNALCRAACVCFGTDSALCRAAWVLLVLAVRCVVLLVFC